MKELRSKAALIKAQSSKLIISDEDKLEVLFREFVRKFKNFL